ncbi:MAG: hypothetical protein A2020_01250 [Lentisphaerae bacterium GWF2_45_14]|nr:MAG: hypothetical protein A2020_01250 [Lentisphaerae bacterium GWF2_45_14]
MKSQLKRLAVFIAAVSIFSGTVFCASTALAQSPASAPAATETAAAPALPGAEGEKKAEKNQDTFWDIIINSGVIGIFIWILLFGSSAAALGLIIDGFITVRQNKIMPPTLIDSVRTALSEGDLGAALQACETQPGPLSNILMAGFNNVSEGFDVIMDSVSTAAGIESEKLMQRVNYLNLCGAIAPMLGLMGTVTGMVDAFSGLASAQGAEKAQMLAMAISQALYTTAVGLLVSVPAIIGFTFIRNNASKIILNMESLTYDLVKVLRGAEVVEDSEDDSDEE